MTQVSRNGFRDKNGKQVYLIPAPHTHPISDIKGLEEEYAGTVVEFSASEAIDAILTEGIHRISYKADGKKYPTKHLLVVYKNYGKPSAIKPTRYMVMQTLIDWSGIHNRRKLFIDEELTEPDGDWTDWVSMILTVDSTITEDGDNPVTGAAIYDALAKKANFYNGTLRVDSAGDNSYPIPEDGNVQTALDSFIENAEQDKMYNVLVQFANQYSFNNYYPAIVYWTINSQDSVEVHIYVGDYHFKATKAEGATAWEDEEFDRSKISSFLETF